MAKYFLFDTETTGNQEKDRITPVLVDIFKFGKYKGRQVADIAKEDSKYLSWMKNNMELDEDLLCTLNYFNIN